MSDVGKSSGDPLSDPFGPVEIQGPGGTFSVETAGARPELQNGNRYRDSRHDLYFYFHLEFLPNKTYDVQIDRISRGPFGLPVRPRSGEDLASVCRNIKYFVENRSWAWPFIQKESKGRLRRVSFGPGVVS